jgi:hypothetical protein
MLDLLGGFLRYSSANLKICLVYKKYAGLDAAAYFLHTGESGKQAQDAVFEIGD